MEEGGEVLGLVDDEAVEDGAGVGRGVGVHQAAQGLVVATVRGVIARGHGVEGVHLEVGQAELLGALAGLELEARVVGEHQGIEGAAPRARSGGRW